MLRKPHLAALLAILALACPSFAAQKKPHAAKPAGPGPDKALMQKIWDGWATLDAAHQAQFYAQGPHTFFDVAPLKYSNWDEYQKTVAKELAGYKSAKFTVNDDAEVHRSGDTAWGAATVKEDAVTKAGRHEMATFRWTVIFEKQGDKWLIVHEHVSEPAP